ncbi:MAG TPA: helix-turn-helix transcriptional regulator [Oculatellaceae cyanobacterium]
MRKTAGNQDTWLMALGEAIRGRRMQLQISQQDLAIDAGVHRTYISDIERGSRNLTVLTLNRIAQALETSASALYVKADELFAAGGNGST